jgi:hypothetical protein
MIKPLVREEAAKRVATARGETYKSATLTLSLN